MYLARQEWQLSCSQWPIYNTCHRKKLIGGLHSECSSQDCPDICWSWYWHSLQLKQPENGDRILCNVRPTSCPHNPCLTWLNRSACEMGDQMGREVNQLIFDGRHATSNVKAGDSVSSWRNPPWNAPYWITTSLSQICHFWARWQSRYWCLRFRGSWMKLIIWAPFKLASYQASRWKQSWSSWWTILYYNLIYRRNVFETMGYSVLLAQLARLWLE